jgi:hypothetical protein
VKQAKRFPNHPYKWVRRAIAICAASIVGQAFLPATKERASVTLSPGANIQSAINSNSAGTAFILQPGVYRMLSLPQTGDSFTGQTGADLNGSQVLTN